MADKAGMDFILVRYLKHVNNKALIKNQ